MKRAPGVLKNRIQRISCIYFVPYLNTLYNNNHILFISIHRNEDESFYPANEMQASDKLGDPDSKAKGLNINHGSDIVCNLGILPEHALCMHAL